MFDPKIKISKALYDKLKLVCEIRGVSSVEELVEKLLNDSADSIITTAGKAPFSQQDIDQIENSLKGLGYLE